MKLTSKPIVFFGNERIATGVSTTAPTLRRLIEAGYTVAAVVSKYEPGLSRTKRSLEIAEVAAEYNIPLLLPAKLQDIREQLGALDAELGVLVAYGKMVPESIIQLFPKGIVNIHPSLLPLHRGSIPIESVILEGATETGVSIMSLVKAMDAGPVYLQRTITLDGTETKQQLADTLLDLGGDMLLEVLPGIIDGARQAIPQDNTRATYDDLLSRNDADIDWAKPAIRIEREIRAFSEWPRTRATLGNIDAVLVKAHVTPASGTPGDISIIDKQLVVYCGNDALVIDRLKPAGKKEMTGEAFLAGYKSQIGL